MTAKLYQPIVDFWQCHRCPGCRVKNWTYHGHSQREYEDGPLICECHHCGDLYWMMEKAQVEFDFCIDDEMIEDGITESPEEYYGVNVGKGRKSPD